MKIKEGNTYKCICGKEFTNFQSFNGHKSHCKEHQLQKYGNLDKLENSNKLRVKNSHQKLSKNFIDKQEQKLQQWISEQHKCEKCGKIMTEKYASGRFCSEYCARGSCNYKGINDKLLEEQKMYKFQCEYCDKKFNNKKSLIAHIANSHKVEKHDKWLNENVKIRNSDLYLNITNKELIEYKNKHTRCEICGKSIEDIKNESNHFKNLCIDHNHTTNEFRGLLCMTCNSALGWFEKNEKQILKYLNDKGKQNDPVM